jgi:ABC-type amino acid transport substrate-binding protein
MLVIAVLVLGVLLTYVYLGGGEARESKPAKQSAYDRVIQSGVLRCSYGLWEPAVMRDPNTGQFSGLIYDLMQEVGKATNLKVEYMLEVPWDQIGVALQSGKADAHCAGVFATPARGRVMAFSNPLFFSPTVMFARADDTRFDGDVRRLNDPRYTIALSDDDITTEIYIRDFPLAKKYELPQFAPPEELFLAVKTGKADATINGPSRLATFERSYPGSIKVIPTDRPVRIFPNTISVSLDDQKLLHLLNTAIDQMIDAGVVDQLVKRYGRDHDMSFLVQVKRPYEWTTTIKKEK